MEVTVGRGGSVLPEGSTVRIVVLLTVGVGVTVTTLVLGVWVLGSLVEVADAADLMRPASSETPGLTDWLLELLGDEIEEAFADVLAVVVSTMGACGACGMKKLGEMLMGWELQSQPATTAPALLVWMSFDGMLFTRPMTV